VSAIRPTGAPRARPDARPKQASPINPIDMSTAAAAGIPGTASLLTVRNIGS